MSRVTMRAAILAAVIGGVAAGASVMAQQQPPAQSPWNGCCGMSRWPMMGPGMMGPE